MTQTNRERFFATYSGKALLKKHNLNDEGIWEVFGEDPNCDFGGPHHSPHLITVRGKLNEVIDVAVDLPNFWTWGGGGNIKLVIVHTMESLRNQHALLQQKAKLEEELKEVNSLLKV
jgi:hypothetical protein